jgi:hypothetical protein
LYCICIDPANETKLFMNDANGIYFIIFLVSFVASNKLKHMPHLNPPKNYFHRFNSKITPSSGERKTLQDKRLNPYIYYYTIDKNNNTDHIIYIIPGINKIICTVNGTRGF